MTYIADEAKDLALDYIKFNTTELHYCSQAPTDYTEASLTYSLGYKTGPTITGPAGTPRSLTIESFNDAVALTTGVANHYALVSAISLLAVGELASDLNISGGYDLGMPEIQLAADSTTL